MRVKDHWIRQLRGRDTNMIKVLWNLKTCDSVWELEDKTRESYPYLFHNELFFKDEILLLLKESLRPMFYFNIGFK